MLIGAVWTVYADLLFFTGEMKDFNPKGDRLAHF